MPALMCIQVNERCVWQSASVSWNGNSAVGEKEVSRRKFIMADKGKGLFNLVCVNL
jgi:hypothetical protein